MSQQHEIEKTPSAEDMLQAEIKEFLDRNPYPGFSNPFRLKELRVNELTGQVRDTRSFVIILEGVGEEDIPNLEREWMRALYEIGERWEMELRLPHWYFEK